jgi:putative FmdB family regulatory protein
MPLYEYKCRSCGKTFEVIQRFSDEPLTTHPECGGIVDKLLSAPAFHLKGTGWYATDYPKGAAPKTESKSESKSEPAATESKSESKSESKPATESKPSPVT